MGEKTETVALSKCKMKSPHPVSYYTGATQFTNSDMNINSLLTDTQRHMQKQVDFKRQSCMGRKKCCL